MRVLTAKNAAVVIVLVTLGFAAMAVTIVFLSETTYSVDAPAELTVVSGGKPVLFDVVYNYVSGERRYLYTFGNFLGASAPPCSGVNGPGGTPSFTSEKWSLACFGKPGDYIYYVQGSTDEKASKNWRYASIIVHVVSGSLSNDIVLTVRYALAGGGAHATAPFLTYMHGGVSRQQVLTEKPASLMVDPGSYWMVTPNPLSGSNENERWYLTQPTSGKVTTDQIITITYQHQYRLDIQISPPNSGVAPLTTLWQNAGTTVKITATPQAGYAFNKWEGHGDGSYTGPNNPATVTMNSPITETVYFAASG